MIHYIRDTTNSFLSFVKDDPVRPEIPAEFRVSNGRLVIVLSDETPEDTPEAMVCVSFHNAIPENVAGLDNTAESPTCAVYYTVWSYKPGAGRTVLMKSMDYIKVHFPTVTTFVTLSPKTDMARRFHLSNGAVLFRENETTINYLYS